MNIDDNQDPVPHDEPDDPEFIKAALLLKKTWDLNPDSRPIPKREFPETVPEKNLQNKLPHNRRTKPCFPQKNATSANVSCAAIPTANKSRRNSSTGTTFGTSPNTRRSPTVARIIATPESSA